MIATQTTSQDVTVQAPSLDDPAALWTQALGELRLQMTQAAFDTWLRDSRCLGCEDGTILIEVRSGYAKDWLEHHLLPPIKRALTQLAGRSITARFTVSKDTPQVLSSSSLFDLPQASSNGRGTIAVLEALLTRISDPDALLTIQHELERLRNGHTTEKPWAPPECDTGTHWFKVPGYTTTFWAPLLGTIAYRVWEIVRQRDVRTEEAKQRAPWTPPQRFSAPELARLVPCGRLAISGVWRKCNPDHAGAVLRVPDAIIAVDTTDEPADRDSEEDGAGYYRRQVGALERLQSEGVARVQSHGSRHRVYEISVRVTLPVLSPTQAVRLDIELQTQHDRWINANGITLEEWRDGSPY